MSEAMRDKIARLAREGLTPRKIGLVLNISDYSVRYVLDHNGERAKNRVRVALWRAERRMA